MCNMIVHFGKGNSIRREMDGWNARSGSGLPGGSRLGALLGLGALADDGRGALSVSCGRASTGSHLACATSS